MPEDIKAALIVAYGIFCLFIGYDLGKNENKNK